ncbi:MAG: acyl-CoA dehydrogenase family protein [Halobacteriales archaeon]|nr:acyl-CoA dehydrogenase family protein [Halobacteriales archaeon]
METPIDYSEYERGQDCNYWELDPAIRRTVERRVGLDEDLEERLSSFGETVGRQVSPNADVVADNPPKLRTYDRNGERVNKVNYHPKHLENEKLVYESGLIADLFEAPPGRDDTVSHVEHFARFYLMEYSSSTGLGCPAAMTGGAALLLEKFDDGSLDEYYDALTARDYDDLETGAMFLTEKQGGSDVGANDTVAEPTGEEGVYELTGEKWFCSNIDSGAALVLARRPDAPEGTEGLSLFMVPNEKRNGEPNDFLYRRLKDKLGTKSVPTGEVVFEGAEAYLLGETEEGFKYMSEMLNMERLYNAIGSVSGRALLESRIHVANRDAFGKKLKNQPLMKRDMVDMTVRHEAAVEATFEAVEQFGRREEAERAGETDEHAYRLMRILTPVVKYKTARMAVDNASYAMEIKGGDGYVEEFVHPRLLRNAQVTPIWEGASNIMALDVLRSMASELAHRAFVEEFDGRLDKIDDPRLDETVATVREELDALSDAFDAMESVEPDIAQHEAKQLADFIYDVTAAVCLLERAEWRLEEADDAREKLVAEWFIRDRFETHDTRGIVEDERDTTPLEEYDSIVRYDRVAPERAVAEPTD